MRGSSDYYNWLNGSTSPTDTIVPSTSVGSVPMISGTGTAAQAIAFSGETSRTAIDDDGVSTEDLPQAGDTDGEFSSDELMGRTDGMLDFPFFGPALPVWGN